jgi:hypothetical protein
MIRKLKLQLEQLRVDSFSTDAAGAAEGTVHGHTGPGTCATCIAYTACAGVTCYQTCMSCAGPSCDNVCPSAANCPNLPDM